MHCRSTSRSPSLPKGILCNWWKTKRIRQCPARETIELDGNAQNHGYFNFIYVIACSAEYLGPKEFDSFWSERYSRLHNRFAAAFWKNIVYIWLLMWLPKVSFQWFYVILCSPFITFNANTAARTIQYSLQRYYDQLERETCFSTMVTIWTLLTNECQCDFGIFGSHIRSQI